MIEDVHVKLYQVCHNKSGTQQEGDNLHWKTEFKFKKISEKCYVSSRALYGDEICTL
jgi:hypothetical protein